jgi:hypothetical protein
MKCKSLALYSGYSSVLLNFNARQMEIMHHQFTSD